jgi:hypothetical protein
MKRMIVPLLALVVGVAACSSAPAEPELVGLRASSDPAVGDSRFLFAVNEIDGTRRGSPDEKVTVTATSLDDPDTVLTDDADFMWIIEPSIGLYRADLPFDTAGTWEIDFDVSTGEVTQPFLVTVGETTRTVAIGAPAPAIATPTLADTSLDDLTTDASPDEGFYDMSLDEALSNGNKTVVVFATPAFCTSASCGPMMAHAKDLSQAYPDVNWVHVEVYEGFNDATFAPDVEHLAPAVVAYGLPSEPWVFVMDQEGVVVARFEGVIGTGELEAILETS